MSYCSQNEIPEELTQMVENLMKTQFTQDLDKLKNSVDRIQEVNSFKFIFNVWDFTGHILYFLLHQVIILSLNGL